MIHSAQSDSDRDASMQRTPQDPPGARSIRVGILTPIEKLDPREAVDNVSGLILGQVFETPYGMMAGETRVSPVLFAEMLRHEGGLTYSAAVRDDIRFSDGSPLTAEIAATSLSNSTLLVDKARVEARDHRVWFTLATPNPRFELTLTNGNCAIVLDRDGRVFGTGPLMFAEEPKLPLLQQSPAIRLVRNPHYRRPFDLEEVRFTICPADDDGAPTSLLNALRYNELDLTPALTLEDLSRHGLTGYQISMQPGNSTGVLFFNTERRPLKSVLVRRGLARSLDLAEIAAACYGSNAAAYVATSLLPPMMRRTISPLETDRSEGRRLLERSGEKPKRLSLLVPWSPRPYMPKPQRVAEIIAMQLGTVGTNVELIETTSGEEFFEDLDRGEYDLALAGWIADTPDPADFYEALLWSKMSEGKLHSNHSRWVDDATDAALAAFRGQPGDENRKAIESLIAESVPLVPLVYGQSLVVHSPRLQNVRSSATGILALAGITVV